MDDCQCGYTDPRDNHFARVSYRYTYENTSRENREWLRELPAEIRLKRQGLNVLLCHGSPRKQNEFLWESTTPDHFLEKLCDDYEADVLAVTHSGIKWKRVLPSGRVVVNVGVLGRPENDGGVDVWYAELTVRPGEGAAASRADVEFVPVAYDYRGLAQDMRAEGLPAEFIETVETGWWTTCLEILPSKERFRGKH
ncbi:MAG: metallophosphoesterase [Planctomycetota bacterium]